MLLFEDCRAIQKPIMSRLMQLYQHDFSEFARAVDDDGLFSYIYLDSYWTEDCWSHSGAAVDWCMSEFFVMRKYRRCGIGRDAACQIICGHPGVWEIPIASYNLPAAAFWKNAVACLANHDIEGAHRRWCPMVRSHPSADNKAASKCRFAMIYNSTASAQCSPRTIGFVRSGFTTGMRSV